MPKRLSEMTEAELTLLLQALGETVGACIPKGTAFLVLLFEDKQAQYVSNAARGDVARALRHCAEKLEAQQEAPRVAFDR